MQVCLLSFFIQWAGTWQQAKSDGFVKSIYLLKYFFIGSNRSEKRTIDDVVKKDREYWTAVMDDVLIDALLHQHHLGNRNGPNAMMCLRMDWVVLLGIPITKMWSAESELWESLIQVCHLYYVYICFSNGSTNMDLCTCILKLQLPIWVKFVI